MPTGADTDSHATKDRAVSDRKELHPTAADFFTACFYRSRQLLIVATDASFYLSIRQNLTPT